MFSAAQREVKGVVVLALKDEFVSRSSAVEAPGGSEAELADVFGRTWEPKSETK